MSVQNFDHRSIKELVTGTSGTGKTTLFESLVRKHKARWKFVFDHQGEFSARFKVPAAMCLEDLIAAVERTGWVCFDPVEQFRGKSERGFEFFCDFAFAIAETLRGRKVFACDELQKLTTNREACEELLTILDTGRRYQLDFFAISQAPNRIHNAIRNQLTKIYTFRQSDANAVAYLADNGFDAEAIRNLPRGKYLWRNLDTGEAGEGGEAF